MIVGAIVGAIVGVVVGAVVGVELVCGVHAGAGFQAMQHSMPVQVHVTHTPRLGRL